MISEEVSTERVMCNTLLQRKIPLLTYSDNMAQHDSRLGCHVSENFPNLTILRVKSYKLFSKISNALKMDTFRN